MQRWVTVYQKSSDWRPWLWKTRYSVETHVYFVRRPHKYPQEFDELDRADNRIHTRIGDEDYFEWIKPATLNDRRALDKYVHHRIRRCEVHGRPTIDATITADGISALGLACKEVFDRRCIGDDADVVAAVAAAEEIPPAQVDTSRGAIPRTRNPDADAIPTAPVDTSRGAIPKTGNAARNRRNRQPDQELDEMGASINNNPNANDEVAIAGPSGQHRSRSKETTL